MTGLDWKYYIYEKLGSIKESDLDTPFIAIWVFMKSLVFGAFFDLLYNLYPTVKALLTEELNIPPPEFTINFPFWIIAFAAGRTATRLGSIIGHIAGLVFLYIALLPELYDSTDLQTFIINAFGKFVLYGLGAWSTKLYRRKSRDPGIYRTRKGMFRFEIKTSDETEAQNIKSAVENLANNSCMCDKHEVYIDAKPESSKMTRYIIRGMLSGPRFSLPGLKQSFENLFVDDKQIKSTPFLNLGVEKSFDDKK